MLSSNVRSKLPTMINVQNSLITKINLNNLNTYVMMHNFSIYCINISIKMYLYCNLHVLYLYVYIVYVYECNETNTRNNCTYNINSVDVIVITQINRSNYDCKMCTIISNSNYEKQTTMFPFSLLLYMLILLLKLLLFIVVVISFEVQSPLWGSLQLIIGYLFRLSVDIYIGNPLYVQLKILIFQLLTNFLFSRTYMFAISIILISDCLIMLTYVAHLILCKFKKLSHFNYHGLISVLIMLLNYTTRVQNIIYYYVVCSVKRNLNGMLITFIYTCTCITICTHNVCIRYTCILIGEPDIHVWLYEVSYTCKQLHNCIILCQYKSIISKTENVNPLSNVNHQISCKFRISNANFVQHIDRMLYLLYEYVYCMCMLYFAYRPITIYYTFS